MKKLANALENTDLNKTPGPDGIHGRMISNLGKIGKERLLNIFNNSWKTGKLPQDCKTATIIPIKKLDKSADDPKNYRPISLTNICCKLMEKIILRRLTYHPDTRNLLPEEQYGFRKGHGTKDQLLFFTQKEEWGAEATTLKLTYTSLMRPILEYGYQIYGTASETNLKSLERIQLSAARNITGLRKTCPNNIVLYEADIMPLKDRISYNLPKYINKIKKYLKQLEIINKILKNAITIYTDGSRDELGHTGSGCLIKTTNGIEKINRRNPEFCSVFRSELIAIYEVSKSIRNIKHHYIWILTDSRSAIQHLSHTGDLRDKVSRNIIGYIQKLSIPQKFTFNGYPYMLALKAMKLLMR
ncbi:hypothetical protein LAZ67_8002079 [Cordylochernes scorpioides]|uniref:Reverse transcriptase domain-containing protein n=1 Tax=Cordylochernes scorpioides TaxID=51811 RepID=A0ABY6KQQ0_9ARAC|nr:hypothetical protein LAZ67_8002079 [Cordylochernes scorpioides]